MKLVNMNNKQTLPIGQKGFSPLLLVVLMAAGIIAGTILVQNGINFIPKAAEQESLNPSAGNTKDCSKAEGDAAKSDCQKTNDVICAKDTVTYCDNRSGSPRAIRKSGGYYEPGNANADPASGCVFDYREVESKKSECGKAESKNGDVVYTTKDEAQKLDSDRTDQVKKNSDKQSSEDTRQTTACTEASGKAYYDAKVANNLARFYAIRNGAGGLCVPADLGVPVKDDVTVNGVEGRLMLCSSSKDDPPKLSWMIASYKDNSLISVPTSIKAAPDADTLEAGFKNLQKARCKAGLDTGEKCKEE